MMELGRFSVTLTMLLIAAVLCLSCGDELALCLGPEQTNTEGGCTVTWPSCSDGSEYEVQCSVDQASEVVVCTCLSGGSELSGDFQAEQFCSWNDGTQTRAANEGCSWNIN